MKEPRTKQVKVTRKRIEKTSSLLEEITASRQEESGWLSRTEICSGHQGEISGNA